MTIAPTMSAKPRYRIRQRLQSQLELLRETVVEMTDTGIEPTEDNRILADIVIRSLALLIDFSPSTLPTSDINVINQTIIAANNRRRVETAKRKMRTRNPGMAMPRRASGACCPLPYSRPRLTRAETE